MDCPTGAEVGWVLEGCGAQGQREQAWACRPVGATRGQEGLRARCRGLAARMSFSPCTCALLSAGCWRTPTSAAPSMRLLTRHVHSWHAVCRLLAEYLEHAPASLVADAVEYLSGEPLLHMVHTKEGAKAACMVLAYGTGEERWEREGGGGEALRKRAGGGGAGGCPLQCCCCCCGWCADEGAKAACITTCSCCSISTCSEG